MATPSPVKSSAEPLTHLDRRHFLSVFSALGLGSTLMPGVLWGMAQKEEAPRVTKEMIDEAALVAGVDIHDEYKQMMLENLNDQLKDFKAIYDLHIPNGVPPAVQFDPVLPGMKVPTGPKQSSRMSRTSVETPKNIEDVAFYSVRQLAELVRTKRISSIALTEMYLERLKRYDPLLHFVITLTEDRARAKAKEADAEIAAGKYRGPLHGLPWGAKDLLAVKGYPTTWGAAGFEKQAIDDDATVVKRLDAAGAVLVAKTTLGALAQGDLWFGGITRNPWRPQQGSSGSSAGSASATAAGCVAFAIGSEALGSIASPSTRCGTTGLRPTFGRIPRTGAMALSWSMDKLGPICRSVEDCALVLDAIYGPDQQDPTVRDVPFSWNPDLDIKKLRIGYLKEDFDRVPKFTEETKPDEKEKVLKQRAAAKKFDDAALEVLRNKIGIEMKAVKMPDLPFSAMVNVLLAEAAAAFDELTRSGRDKLLTAQTSHDWPNSFRIARFYPAVEYIQANRARTIGMRKMAELFKDFDVIVAPTNSSQLVITNLTGHPAVILPNGFRSDDASLPTRKKPDVNDKTVQVEDEGGGPGTPVSLTFLGDLYGEAKLLAVAKAYQDGTGFHLKHPKLEAPAPEAKKA